MDFKALQRIMQSAMLYGKMFIAFGILYEFLRRWMLLNISKADKKKKAEKAFHVSMGFTANFAFI